MFIGCGGNLVIWNDGRTFFKNKKLSDKDKVILSVKEIRRLIETIRENEKGNDF
jgi:hypothetical protein